MTDAPSLVFIHWKESIVPKAFPFAGAASGAAVSGVILDVEVFVAVVANVGLARKSRPPVRSESVGQKPTLAGSTRGHDVNIGSSVCVTVEGDAPPVG